jgi:hypothetical protein
MYVRHIRSCSTLPLFISSWGAGDFLAASCGVKRPTWWRPTRLLPADAVPGAAVEEGEAETSVWADRDGPRNWGNGDSKQVRQKSFISDETWRPLIYNNNKKGTVSCGYCSEFVKREETEVNSSVKAVVIQRLKKRRGKYFNKSCGKFKD